MESLEFAVKGTAVGMCFLFAMFALALLVCRLFTEKVRSARVGHFLIRARVVRQNENGDIRTQATYYSGNRDGMATFATRMACGNFYNDFTEATELANQLRDDFEDRFGNSTAKVDIIEKRKYPLLGEIWETVASR